MPSEETLDKIQNFFEGVFTVFKEIGVVLKAIFQPFGDMIKSLFAKPEGEGEGVYPQEVSVIASGGYAASYSASHGNTTPLCYSTTDRDCSLLAATGGKAGLVQGRELNSQA